MAADNSIIVGIEQPKRAPIPNRVDDFMERTQAIIDEDLRIRKWLDDPKAPMGPGVLQKYS